MQSVPSRAIGTRRVTFVLLLMVGAALAGGCSYTAPDPRPGLMDFERGAVETLGDVRVHLADGNLSSERIDLVLDTRVGPLVVGAVFNSATGAWTWRHQMRLAGGVFVDDTGAELDVSDVPDGRAIPGTRWVRVDATRIKSKGGLVHRFDAIDGRLVEVHWSDAAYPLLRYVAGGSNGLDRVEQCVSAESCRVQLTFAWDAGGCLASVVDRAGRMADYVHDEACRTRVARDAFDVEQGLPGRRYEYDGAGRLRAIVTSEGERTELDWAAQNVARVRRIGHGDPEHRFAFALAAGGERRAALETTPSGEVWVYELDGARRLVRRLSPEGDVVTQTWSGLRPVTTTDAAGQTWRYAWEDDDLVRLERPSGEVELRVYAPGAVDRRRPDVRPVLRVNDALGVRVERAYDAAGRLAAYTTGAGETVHYTWDELGQLATSTTLDGRVIRYLDYGEHGHATRIQRGEIEEIRLFDAVGNLEKGGSLSGELAPGRPGLLRRRFDAGRNVAEIVTVETALEALTIVPASTRIERRSDGRVLRIERPYGGEERFVYDGLGRLVERRERVDGIDRVTTLEFDLEGRPKRSVLPNGMRTDLEWDGDGRLVRVDRVRPGAPWERLAMTYEAGRVVRVDDRTYAAPEWIEYDVDGRVSAIDHASGGRTELRHDVRGRETRRRVYDPVVGALVFETTRTWDGAGRPLATRLGGELLVERSWVGGRRAEMRYGSGLTRRFAYDAASGELAETRSETASGEVVERTTIARTPGIERLDLEVLGRVVLAGAEGGEPVPHAREEVYRLRWGPTAYDGEPTPGAWLRMSSLAPLADPPRADHVRFDALGNLVGHQPRDGAAVEFELNAEHNRLLSGGFETIHAYTWDEAGFLTSRDGVPFEWTAGGRLSAIGDDVALAWDARGRLVARTIDGETRRYGFGGEIEVDAWGWPLAAEIDGVHVALGSGARRYRHEDFRGNVLFVSDEQGRVLRRHVYRGFGARSIVGRDGAPREPADGERGFAQGMHLAGIQLMGARPYDPDVGRFLAPDPIDHVLNDFAYTRGNPIQLWDPGGTHATPTQPGATQSLAGEATVAVGVGFMALGASMAGNAAAGGPVALHIAAGGIATFVVGTVLVAIGYGMTDAATPQPPRPPTVSPDATDFVPPPETPSASTCAPDGFHPRGERTWHSMLAIALLGALVLWLRRVERRDRVAAGR